MFVGNTLYLVGFGYYFLIFFLGYNGSCLCSPEYLELTRDQALPFLHHTEFLLSPLLIIGILWFASLFGFHIPHAISPVLTLGVGPGW